MILVSGSLHEIVEICVHRTAIGKPDLVPEVSLIPEGFDSNFRKGEVLFSNQLNSLQKF